MAQEYFRFFTVPGAGHSLTDGPTPKRLNDVIVRWVEEGVPPDTLHGIGLNGFGETVERPICMHPQVQVYKSGNTSVASSFDCVDG